MDDSIIRLLTNDAGWRFTLVPAAAEGGGSFVASSRRVPEYVARGMSSDPERSAAEAGRRARSRLRRYCAANRLNRLGTLTYAGAGNHDPRLLREHLGLFFRELRGRVGAEPLPYVWVPEWHKSGHGLHAHFAVGRFVPRGLIESSWGRGFVHIKLLGDLPAIESAHPSPMSADRGFFGSRPFSRANELLLRQGAEPVDWRLP